MPKHSVFATKLLYGIYSETGEGSKFEEDKDMQLLLGSFARLHISVATNSESRNSRSAKLC
jgi:hypothetical protein